MAFHPAEWSNPVDENFVGIRSRRCGGLASVGGPKIDVQPAVARLGLARLSVARTGSLRVLEQAKTPRQLHRIAKPLARRWVCIGKASYSGAHRAAIGRWSSFVPAQNRGFGPIADPTSIQAENDECI